MLNNNGEVVTVSIPCTECEQPFLMSLDSRVQVCPDCQKNNNVAKCNASDSELIEFEKWMESLGSDKRIANVLGVDRSTIWRHRTKGKISKMWIKFMYMSKELEKYKQKYGTKI